MTHLGGFAVSIFQSLGHHLIYTTTLILLASHFATPALSQTPPGLSQGPLGQTGMLFDPIESAQKRVGVACGKDARVVMALPDEEYKKLSEGCKAAIQSYLAIGVGSGPSYSQQECNSARDALSKATTDFNTACSKAGLNQRFAGSPAGMDCVWNALRCNNCSSMPEDVSPEGRREPASGPSSEFKTWSDLKCEEVTSLEKITDGITLPPLTPRLKSPEAYLSNPDALKSGLEGTFDVSEKAAEFLGCPARASANLKGLADDEKSARDRVRSLNESFEDISEKMANDETEFKRKVQEIQDQQAENNSNLKREEENLRRKHKQSNDEIINQILEARANIDRLRDQQQDLRQRKVQARLARNQTRIQLELQCHKRALDKLKQATEAQMELMKRGEYSAGQQVNLFRGVGLTSRQARQKKAEEYFNQCKADKEYQSLMALADQTLSETEKAIDGDIAKHEREVGRIETIISSLETDKTLQAKQEYVFDLRQLEEDARRQWERLDQQLNNLKEDYARRRQVAETRRARIEKDLIREEDYLRQKTAMLQLRRSLSKGRETKLEDLDDALAKYSTYVSAAQSMISRCDECRCDRNGGTLSLCGTARNLLSNLSGFGVHYEDCNANLRSPAGSPGRQ